MDPKGVHCQIRHQKSIQYFSLHLKVLIDRKEGKNFIGRTEADSPEVDNEVLIDASENYLRIGEFVNAKIVDAKEFDLIGKLATKK